MASSSSNPPIRDGSLCWLEIPVLCTVRAAAFYTAIFGWDCTFNNNSSSSNSNDDDDDDDDDTLMLAEESDEDVKKGSNNDSNNDNNNNGVLPRASNTSIQMFRCSGGSDSGGEGNNSSSSSNNTNNNNTSTIRGVFIQVPEEHLLQTWDAHRPGKMAVLTTFSVRDVEETLRRVVEMGGRVHVPKTSIGGDTGYFARFVDPEGNLQGIWAKD